MSDHDHSTDNALERRCTQCGKKKPATEDFFNTRDSMCRPCLAEKRAAKLTAETEERAAERSAGSLAAQNLAPHVNHGSAAHDRNEDIRAARAGAIVPATLSPSRTAISNALKSANNVVEANARLLTERMFVWAMDDKHPLQHWAARLLMDRILPAGVVPAIASADAALPTDPALPVPGEEGKAMSALPAPKQPVAIYINAAPPQPAQGRVVDVSPVPHEERSQ